MNKQEIYDEVYELLASAEMELRNGNYWQVSHKLSEASTLAKQHALSLEKPNDH